MSKKRGVPYDKRVRGVEKADSIFLLWCFLLGLAWGPSAIIAYEKLVADK